MFCATVLVWIFVCLESTRHQFILLQATLWPRIQHISSVPLGKSRFPSLPPSMQEKSGDWWTGAVVVYSGLVRPPTCPVVWCILTLFLGVWEPAYLWAATSLFCHTSRGFWGPSAPCGGSGWSLQMGLLHMGQTLRISSHFTRHLSRRQSEKRRDGFVMHQLSIDSSDLWPRHKMTGWNCRMFLNNQKSDRCYSRLILIFKLLCLDSLICGSCFSASNNILCVRNLHAWMFLKECVVLNVHIVKHQSVFTAS